MRMLEADKKDPVHTLCFLADGSSLLAARGRRGGILSWRMDTFEPESEGPVFLRPVVGIAAAPGLVAVVDSSAMLRVWRGDFGTPGFQAELHRRADGPFPALAFSNDGRWLFCSCGPSDGWGTPASRFETVRGKRSAYRMPDGGTPCQAAFSPDGTRLALCFRKREATVASFPRGERLMTLQHGSKAHMAAYSPDGATLATASPDGLIRIWDAETGRQRVHLKGQAKPLHAIAYSPDGRTLAAACGRGTVTLWDVRTGRSREGFDWGIGAVHSVAFAPDGMRAAAGGDGVLAVWDIDDWGV